MAINRNLIIARELVVLAKSLTAREHEDAEDFICDKDDVHAFGDYADVVLVGKDVKNLDPDDVFSVDDWFGLKFGSNQRRNWELFLKRLDERGRFLNECTLKPGLESKTVASLGFALVIGKAGTLPDEDELDEFLNSLC